MREIGSVVDHKQHSGRGQHVDDALENFTTCGIEPVQIFDDQQQRLATRPQLQDTYGRARDLMSLLSRLERVPGGVADIQIKERTKSRQRALETCVERTHRSDEFGSQRIACSTECYPETCPNCSSNRQIRRIRELRIARQRTTCHC